ncbi:MAG: oligosaccharide flippase family protein [Cellvibrionales bacterium]|nr:oligosaccharide flippase family protein [Cellvibrionales bacterium]
MSILKRNSLLLFKQIISASAFRALALIAGFLTSMLLARTLGAETLGFFALAVAVSSFGNLLINIGLPASLTKFIAQAQALELPNKTLGFINDSIRLRHIHGFLFIALFTLSLSFVTHWLGVDQHRKWLFWLLICIYLLAGLNGIYGGILKGLEKATLGISIDQCVVPLLNALFCGCIYVFFGLSLEKVIAIYGISTLIALYLGKRWVKNHQPEGVSENYTKGKLYKGSLPLFMSSSALIIIGQTDVLMLGHFLDAASVGGYSIALKISLLMNLLVVISNAFLAPKIAAHESLMNYELIKRLIHRVISLHILISVFILGFFYLCLLPLLSLFGEAFLAYQDVAWILVAGQIVNFVGSAMGCLLAYTKFAFFQTGCLLLAAIINIVGNWFFIQWLGITGAAIATAGTLVFINLCFCGFTLGYFYLSTIKENKTGC